MSPLPKATFERASRAAGEMSQPKPTVTDNFGLISDHSLVNGNSNESSESTQSSRGSTVVNGGGIPHTDSSVHPDHNNLVKESERLKTFDRWPVLFLSPRVMTKAGFYYTKERDTVRCAFCGIEIGQWEVGDNPMSDHRRWSPDCRFVKYPPANNISIEDENGTVARQPACGPFPAGVDVCGPFQALGEEPSGTNANNASIHTERFLALLENLGYQKSRAPSFPNYASYNARLRSYDTWPISLKLKPNVLSDAGFFYTGKGDQTVCFHCGGGLKDWEETDEPWVEHARWFSKCLFVLLTKGKEFVEQVNGLKPKESAPRSSSSVDEATSSSTSDRIERPSTKSASLESKSASCSRNSQNESPTPEDGRLCKICFTEEMGVVFLPCGHIVACTKCAVSLTTCAVCREPVTATFRAFLS